MLKQLFTLHNISEILQHIIVVLMHRIIASEEERWCM